jgi:glycerol uptake facilitator-like aquaporin
LGLFLLVLSVLASGGNAFVVGGTLTLIILLVGNLSGANVNPAISVAMFLRGALTVEETMSYIVVQAAAGAQGAALGVRTFGLKRCWRCRGAAGCWPTCRAPCEPIVQRLFRSRIA